MSDERPREEPRSVPLDVQGQQRELEEAGWEKVWRAGKLTWRHPESGRLYPQGMAVARNTEDLREAGDNEG